MAGLWCFWPQLCLSAPAPCASCSLINNPRRLYAILTASLYLRVQLPAAMECHMRNGWAFSISYHMVPIYSICRRGPGGFVVLGERGKYWPLGCDENVDPRPGWQLAGNQYDVGDGDSEKRRNLCEDSNIIKIRGMIQRCPTYFLVHLINRIPASHHRTRLSTKTDQDPYVDMEQ
jgi:hypothetical protein